MFDRYLALWGLVPDGGPILTASGGLLPVLWQARPAMLKVATCDEERRGNALMTWWNGHGAAQVWLHDSDAILLERARPAPSLAQLSASGHDDDTMRIACGVVARLHAHRAPEPVSVVPLRDWFRSLLSDDVGNDVLHRSATIARELLAGPPVDEVVLHGDIHHDNILHFGDRGWLAIDPKGLRGDRAFDYANLFCNPAHEIAADPARFTQRVVCVAEAARLDRRRLLQWILAWAGLSAVWLMEDDLPPDTRLQVARLAAIALDL
ncbi:aminoglycoside phosphotransferase family protein [Burkholderia cepacia]|uniref:aminoglycoside phosphotransferase family protein n=1 Tax=Burkholderia cepacia TaxID=292 RepID=UPI0020196F59|nr:aminoglycoside phosphotransferase family protein [Burkholderia cepacia]UQO37612.1 3'-kinase [Burkholderia cepacia]UQO51948.1 3'-kinase [Burkholderia cepacia]UQP06093.1 3'-kinase [Burkholderia cepacia]